MRSSNALVGNGGFTTGIHLPVVINSRVQRSDTTNTIGSAQVSGGAFVSGSVRRTVSVEPTDGATARVR